MTSVEYRPQGYELRKDAPYLSFSGELWNVCNEYFREKSSGLTQIFVCILYVNLECVGTEFSWFD